MNKTTDASLERLVGRSVPQIARAVGVDKTTIYRQLNGKGLTADMVIAIARAFDLDLLTLLTALGIITDAERRSMRAGSSLDEATDRQLVEEMLRRVVDAEDHPELDGEVDQALIDNVTALQPKRASDVDVAGLTEDQLTEMPHAANTDDSAGEQEPETT